MQLSQISLALTRLGGAAFSPLSLFAGGINGAWYDPSDSTTLFSDRAGTTPCATPGAGAVVPVGLMLDKSQGLVLGSETVTNGGPGFTATTGWTAEGFNTVAVVNGELEVTLNLALFTGISGTNLTTVAGQWYCITVTARKGTTPSNFTLRVDSSSNDIAFTSTNSTTVNYYFRASGTSAAIRFLTAASNGAGTFYVTSVSVKALPGNHAIAANDTTARPELSARVNLLTRTEDFSNAVWGTGASVGRSVTKGTTTGTRPDGTAGTIDTLTFSAVSAGELAIAFQSGGQPFLNVQLTGAIYVRVASGTATIYLNLEDSGNPPSGTNFVAGSAETVTTSWKRISLTGTRATAPNAVSLVIGFDTRAAAGQTNAAPVTIEVWGADLRPTNIGSQIPAYQRVVDANTYDSAGFPRRLVFNGTSSAMSTPANVNLSGTDKATVFLGLRKANDNSAYVPLEFSNASGWTVANGSFAIYAPSYLSGSFPAPKYFVGLRGTTQRQEEFSTFTAPITNVLSESIDIAAAAGSEISMRVNGAVVSPSATAGDAGSGNFGNYPISIGVRPTGSAYFPGDIYSLIVVGSAVSAGNITATETWVNGKTGGVY